ncbi:MAG TPA: putative phage abortive infection protein [Longimicrobium sp.]|nr:putative phage abortive infection protein [Longimicrobium sp.]
MKRYQTTEEREAAIEKHGRQVRRWRSWAVRTFWGGVVLGIAGAVWILAAEGRELPDVGQYLSGTTGTLWALAGVLLIYVAFLGQQVQIIQQQEELDLNRRELEATREEIKGQRQEAEEQNRTLRQQRFEGTFFQFLHSHSENLRGTYLRLPSGDVLRGREAFRALRDEFTHAFSESSSAQPDLISIEQIQRVYEKFHSSYHWAVEHYFQTLYRLIAFVDQNAENPLAYMGIVRARLSSDELFLLFYNALRKGAPPELKILIEQYGLLQQLPLDTLLANDHRGRYAWSAFIEQTEHAAPPH